MKREKGCEEREKVTERDREKVRERLLRHIVLYCNHITSYHVILEDYDLFCFSLFSVFRGLRSMSTKKLKKKNKERDRERERERE